MNFKLKRFLEFEMLIEDKSGTNYDYGCLMVYFDFPNWNNFTEKINVKDLYQASNERYGIETEPHATILYGIHNDVDDDQVIALFSDIKKSEFDLEITGMNCFFNESYDVLKLNVESNKLNELNRLAKKLPHTSEYPDYKPHITIAYLKKGSGLKYQNETMRFTINNIEKIVYSKKNGERISLPVV